jgi:Ca2+-transporting ATPase
MIRSLRAERLADLTVSEQGLSESQVAERRARYGSNRIIETTGTGWLVVLQDTLRDPMLWFLLATSLLFGVVGEYTETIILLLALIPFFGMDAFLHRRTRASVEGLSSRLALQVEVIRDGVQRILAAVDLVPGDIVIIGTGQSFPADGVMVQAERLQADESALTGEAWPVHKSAWTLPERPVDEVRIDGEYWGFAGTRVLTGSARMLVVYTGAETLYGEIVRSAVSGAHERTPLQIAVLNLVKILIVAAAAICLMLAAVRWLQGHGLLDALLSALTLAVAALPEEFPVVLTFFLGVGVYRLAKRQALVRRAVVVENIGRVSCICSDKTGTITEGKLQPYGDVWRSCRRNWSGRRRTAGDQRR